MNALISCWKRLKADVDVVVIEGDQLLRYFFSEARKLEKYLGVHERVSHLFLRSTFLKLTYNILTKTSLQTPMISGDK
jgi:hypothetical protein